MVTVVVPVCVAVAVTVCGVVVAATVDQVVEVAGTVVVPLVRVEEARVVLKVVETVVVLVTVGL